MMTHLGELALKEERTDAWRKLERAVLLIALATIALSRAAPVLRGDGIGASGFDEGVYFGASAALGHGQVLYRDFVFLHPPGLSIILLPFTTVLSAVAGLDRAFLTAKLFAAIAATLTGWLIYLVAVRWHDRKVGLLAVGLYAAYVPAVVIEGRVMLEPFLNLAALAGLYFAIRRRPALAGVWFGVATLIKVYGAIWLAGFVLAVILLDRRKSREALIATAAALGTIAVVTIPFVLIAGPGKVWAQVIEAQVSRPDGVGLPGNISGIGPRALHLFALGPLGRSRPPSALGLVLLLVVLAAAVAATWDRSIVGWTCAVVIAAGTALFLVGPSFYDQYGVFLAPAVSLVVAFAAVALLNVLTPRSAGQIAIAVTLVLVGARFFAAARSFRDPVTPTGKELIVQAAERGCVYADPPFYAFLADVPSGGDTRPLVDPFGELLYLGSGDTAAEVLHSPAAQSRLEEALRACPSVILVGDPGDQFNWTPKTIAGFVATHTLVGRDGNVKVWGRKHPPPP